METGGELGPVGVGASWGSRQGQGPDFNLPPFQNLVSTCFTTFSSLSSGGFFQLLVQFLVLVRRPAPGSYIWTYRQGKYLANILKNKKDIYYCIELLV